VSGIERASDLSIEVARTAPVAAILVLILADQLVGTRGVLEHANVRDVGEGLGDAVDEERQVGDVVVVDPERVDRRQQREALLRVELVVVQHQRRHLGERLEICDASTPK